MYAAEAWRATTAAIETTRRASSAANRSLVGASRRTRALADGMARLPAEETVALLADSAVGLPGRWSARICETIRAGSPDESDRRKSAGSCLVERTSPAVQSRRLERQIPVSRDGSREVPDRVHLHPQVSQPSFVSPTRFGRSFDLSLTLNPGYCIGCRTKNAQTSPLAD